MVSLSSFAKLGAAARNAISNREAQTTQKNLETINTSTLKLASTVEGYDGGLLAANSISGDSASLGLDIKNATSDAKKSEVVTEAEADEIIAYIANTLEPSIKKSLDALKNKKEKLAASSLQGTVLGDLKELYADTKTYGEALVEKAPASRQSEAKAANERVNGLFEAAVKDFSA